MSITSYSELKTAVARWLKRDDLTDLIPDYIAFGENRLWYGDRGQFPTKPFRARLMEFSNGGTIASQTIPPSYLGDTTNSYIETISLSVTSGSDQYDLRYLPPHQFSNYESQPGNPKFYTYQNQQIYTAPSTALPFRHYYYSKYPALSNAAPTNDLFVAYPELYLWAACIEGALDIMSDSMAARFAAKYQGRADAITLADKNRMAGGSLSVTIGR